MKYVLGLFLIGAFVAPSFAAKKKPAAKPVPKIEKNAESATRVTKTEKTAQHKLDNLTVKGRSQVPRLPSEPDVIVAAPALPVDVPSELNAEYTSQVSALRPD